MPMRKTVLAEHLEQATLMRWLSGKIWQYPELALCFAIPNGGKRTIGVARKLKAEGVKPGVPDLFLPVARQGKFGLFIEMKSRIGCASADQKDWKADLEAQGYGVEICRGWEMAALTIGLYIGIPREELNFL